MYKISLIIAKEGYDEYTFENWFAFWVQKQLFDKEMTSVIELITIIILNYAVVLVVTEILRMVFIDNHIKKGGLKTRPFNQIRYFDINVALSMDIPIFCSYHADIY